MSYILDALRRADAERQRGALPGLHAQPAPQWPVGAGGRSLPLGWLLAAAALLLVALAAAWLVGRGGAPSAAPPAARPPQHAAEIAPPPPPAPPAAPTTAAVRAAPARPATVVAPAPAPPPATTALPAAGATTVTVTVTAPAGAVAALPAAASATAPASAPPLSASTRVPALAELPEALRRQLPALALDGGMYSDDAAQRLVLVNGQVAHEGDQPADGLRLVQIRPRSAVFSFRGQLFELGQ